MSKINWNEENTARLVELAGNISEEISQDQLVSIADELGTSTRSIGAKLRKMEYSVAKAAPKASAWTEAQEQALASLVSSNAGNLTYAEIAATFENGAFSAKQVQGKLLSMELYGSVRKAEKKVTPRTYTPEEEARFVALVNEGASIEALAEAFGKEPASIRGKALSLLRAEEISEMPKQEGTSAKVREDALAGLDIEAMTVEALVEATGKTERGIKSMLSRRGLDCEDYKGAARREKLDANK